MAERAQPELVGSHRYALVLALALIVVALLIVAPNAAGSRASGLVLTGTMLLVVIATSRGDRTLREATGITLIAATVLVALAVGLHWVPQSVASAASFLIVLATLVQLVRGLARLVRARGVTLQAVAGALAVYLLVGILFAFLIGAAARIGGETYFAQGTDGTESQHVYFSFTSMTTTGYGDLTPATRVGRAIAVMEMLIGQIYLVTIIGLLVGNLRRARE